MNLRSIVIASVLAATASSAYAGNFVTLTNGNGTTLTSANGGLQNGTQNPNADKFYIETTSATYLAGYNNLNSTDDGGNGRVVETSINYRAFSGSNTLSTGTLTLLDWHVTDNVPLLPNVPQSTIFDFVYRDSADNKLVFATRYLNVTDNRQEINYLYRYGFEGYSAAAAWTYATGYDLRLYQAALTDDHSYNASVAYDSDSVRQKGDFSVSEGNPWSGLFLTKTDAETYVWGDKAIGYYQAGEEGQSVVGGYIGGYVAADFPIVTPPVAAVPEPESYAMMLAGLGLVGWAARRRKTA